MQVQVFSANCDGGSVAVCTGLDVDTKKQVSFGGEPRLVLNVAQDIDNAQTEDDLPIVEIEPWQVL